MTLYRFDAPVLDCIAYGKRLLQQNDSSDATDLIPLKSSPEPIGGLDHMGLEKVGWFDVETVRSGFEGHQVRSAYPKGVFWIDTDRGRFYFWESD